MTNNKFKQEIIENSNDMDYDKSIKEWSYSSEYKTTEPDECICGKKIKNVILIENRFNHNVLHVGNACINKLYELADIKAERKYKNSQKYKKIMDQVNRILKK